MSILDLKKNRQTAIEAVLAEMEKFSQKQTQESDTDERFWYPAVDKAGNGNAIIRFLPPTDGENIPFVRYWQHSFQGPTGRWIYKELCPTTKGGKCPICDYNRNLWNSGDEDKRKQASRQKRQLRFVSNIQVIKDPANPENQGQVRLYLYGQKVWDKINELMHPTAGLDEKAVNPFDFWEGAFFKLKIRNVDGYRNYDKSEFGEVEPLSKDDKVLENIWKKQYPLQPFIADELFKDEKTLKTLLNTVLGLNGEGSDPSPEIEEPPFFGDDVLAKKQAARKAKSKVVEEEEVHVPEDEEMDEDYFKRLASE